MSTLPALRTRLRQELHDPDSLHWDDDALDAHAIHALEELSRAMPRQLAASIASTAGSRELSVASVGDLLDVVRVEYPAGQYPPSLVSFERWGDTVIFDSPALPSGDDVGVSYTARHTLDDEGSTLTPFQEELVVLGASAFAVESLAAASIDTLSTGGPGVPLDYRAWAQARLIAFRQLLHHYGSRPRARTRRLTA